ncbi:MAG: hypothetical protein JW944_09105 [Deltaproteobacteria bacterium]|nr:hypothetical protein [Deltaproteobacteria bacterium]
MERLKNSDSWAVFTLISLTLLFALVSLSCAAQEIKAAPEQGALTANTAANAQAQAADEVTYKTIPITMEMEAGAALYEKWPGGEMTRHTGIGWIHPFGRAEYTAGLGYPEAKDYPIPSYFNDEWVKVYGATRLFCIYMLEDGNIYAYDGIVGNMAPLDKEADDGKMDYLINVIVGGTGAYEGATGMLLGRTPGRGKSAEVIEDYSLPVSILKLMEGYIKIPVKK